MASGLMGGLSEEGLERGRKGAGLDWALKSQARLKAGKEGEMQKAD